MRPPPIRHSRCVHRQPGGEWVHSSLLGARRRLERAISEKLNPVPRPRSSVPRPPPPVLGGLVGGIWSMSSHLVHLRPTMGRWSTPPLPPRGSGVSSNFGDAQT
eukprot:TRINITY_DN12555_c0_g1_i1.p3 TRINITY_DN12555_c0_g1~~TRINITY_DN12555_c0_g1_i1.p3  ORF type:complete len:104 (-),score=0.66 TRINITY_DN12555_c0_g1_i1:727-1038(-)